MYVSVFVCVSSLHRERVVPLGLQQDHDRASEGKKREKLNLAVLDLAKTLSFTSSKFIRHAFVNFFSLVLLSQVRIENVKDPQDYIGAMLERVKEDYIRKAYNVLSWEDAENFLEQVARRLGKLLKVPLLSCLVLSFQF